MDEILMIRRQSWRRPKPWLMLVLTLGWYYIQWKSNYIALTKRSVLKRSGVLNKEERSIPLNQVQDVSISHGILRRLIGDGSISIETAGSDTTEIVMNYIPDPRGFRAKTFELIDAFYDEGKVKLEPTE